jgi:hypothetical protein
MDVHGLPRSVGTEVASAKSRGGGKGGVE